MIFFTQVAACANADNYNGEDRLFIFYPSRNSISNGGLGRTAVEQGGYQIAALVVTLVIAIFGGAITGLVLKTPLFEQKDSKTDFFDDEIDWVVPNDGLFLKNNNTVITQI